MWEYASKIGKRIIAAACVLAIGSSYGCTAKEWNDFWSEGYKEWKAIADSGPNNSSNSSNSLQQGNLELELETMKLKRLNEKMELENSIKIKNMQLELMRREAEQKLRNYKR